MHSKSIVLIVCSIFFSSCNNDNSIVRFYDKSINKIDCLSLEENNETLLKDLKKLYHFKKNCPYKLSLTTQSKIVCKSPFNATAKTTTNFPSSYINLEIRKNFNIIYTYYRDLTSKASKDDLKKAFKRLKSDILY